ncbi:phospholipase D family protein [Variovorax sp. J22G73]|jgi:putative cardiolipin synthase|uniref:phospholipase D family protein n=1 Tax=unclassified Variovorax TaxID=663243 RepID=UPI000D5F5849|nr:MULTISPECIES: phospholipase D family protein [unclassified Variovorax]MDM0004195.1 phospholipase D family protein [Variovorax sp. J22R203]MDM0096139.1 phospholipase D family protein [Variovorax sp. J22G73]
MPAARMFTRWLALLAAAGALALLQACASLPPSVQRTPSAAVPASADELLSRIAAQSAPPGTQSGFRPLPLSAWSMDARLTLVRHAQKTLDLQYYLLQNDVTGHTLLRAVRDAAGRGVRVRLLVDDLYTADSDRMLLAFAAHPNVEVRLFNPFPSGRSFALTRWVMALGDFSRVNHRMHNKMLVADGAFAVAGGRNIADEYFFGSKGGNFVDFDLLVAGDAVPRMAAIFDIYWNSPRIYPLHALETSRKAPAELQAEFEALTVDAIDAYPSPAADKTDILGYLPLSADLQHPPLKLLHGAIDVFSDDPEKVSGRAESGVDDTTVTARAGRAMANATSEVVVGSPYFIPGQPGMAGLRQARANGVRVEVVTNSLASNDEPFASAAYGRYRVEMLKLGAELYETDSSQLKNDSLIAAALHASIGRSHSKLIVIDRRTTFVGSMNMDFRSSRVNTELGMLVDSPELARNVLSLAERVRAVGSFRLRLAQPGDRLQWVGSVNGAETVYESDPGVDFGTRLQLWLLFPFISESLL